MMKIVNFIKELFSDKSEHELAFVAINGYDVPNNPIAQRTVLQYFEDEKKVLEDIESKEKEAERNLSKAQGISRLFFESFLLHYREDQISSLSSYYYFEDTQVFFEDKYSWRQTEDYPFDEDFNKIAELVVENQSIEIQEWYDDSFDFEREERVIEHLYECGIIIKSMTSDDPIILVQSKKDLKKILKKLNGKTLLPKQDKEMLNIFFTKREKELIKDTPERHIGLNSNPDLEDLYHGLLAAFDQLSQCITSCEVLSKEEVDNHKSSADCAIKTETCFFPCSKAVFNYVYPYGTDKKAPCIKFEKIDKISLYFYPEYVICAKSNTDFKIQSLRDFELRFNLTHVIYESDFMLLKDVKLIGSTYKYVNKNGERDARYKNNPRYNKYEFGELTFGENKMVMQFTNAEAAKQFYMAFTMLKNAATRNPSLLDENKTSTDSSLRGSSDKHKRSNSIEDLNNLIGLHSVKKEITALTNYIKIQKLREQNGLKTVPLSYHCVFTGNPGTGKTTVARIVASIYKEIGVLKKGHLIETDRSGLVAEYVGQTAVKTNAIIDSALDGVLFIDEAYSLAQGGTNDYGREAISTLLKRMEDDRNRLVVILAGYSEDMKLFIDSNPGLQSRFNRYIHFEDYGVEDLLKIFQINVKKNQYELDAKALEKARVIFADALKNKDKNFGNGRFVRNLFEKTIQNQAMRLSDKDNNSSRDLSLIIAEDLIN